MEPPKPQQNENSSSLNIPSSPFGSSDPNSSIRPRKSYKKLFIIVGVSFALLVITGTGLFIWAAQTRNHQLAQEAKLEAEKKAKARAEAKAREGTVSDLNLSIERELKQIQETNDRALYNLGDRLKQEVDGAATIGTGNENDL